MKKIAYLVSCFPAVSHTFIQREIEALKQKGFEITLFSINDSNIAPEKLSALEQEAIQETYYVKKTPLFEIWNALCHSFTQSPIRFMGTFFNALRHGFYSLFYFIEAAIVGSKMSKKGLKHLHVHFANPGAMVANLVQRLFDIPYSITVHGPDEFYDVTPNQLVGKFKEAQFLVCISYYAQAQVMRLIPPTLWNKLHIIRMGVDPEIYKPHRKRSNEEKFTLLSVGRLAPSKGQMILCQAVQELQSEGLPIVLNLIGEGSEKRWLNKFGSESLHLLGALNPDEVLHHLQNCDLFILSSFAEGIPVSLMEAMAMEIPCIAPGINGIPELIIHEKSGLLIYPSDVEGTKAAIQRLFHSKDLREELGRKGRERVEKEYDLKTNTKQLAELFSSEIKV